VVPVVATIGLTFDEPIAVTAGTMGPASYVAKTISPYLPPDATK
jgi:hypothetical protein